MKSLVKHTATSLLASCFCSAALGICLEESVQTESLRAHSQISVTAQAYRVSPAHFELNVRLMSHGKVLQSARIEAEGEAYQPSFDTTVDLNGDGVFDLGVATGKGRSGDGMHYWIISKKPLRMTDVGEAPRLQRATGPGKDLWALVPGSGDVQATRLTFQLLKQRLLPRQAIQLAPQSDNSYQLTFLESRQGEFVAPPNTPPRRVSEEEAQRCMEGGACPF